MPTPSQLRFDFVQLSLENLWRWRFHHSSGQLNPVPHYLPAKVLCVFIQTSWAAICSCCLCRTSQWRKVWLHRLCNSPLHGSRLPSITLQPLLSQINQTSASPCSHPPADISRNYSCFTTSAVWVQLTTDTQRCVHLYGWGNHRSVSTPARLIFSSSPLNYFMQYAKPNYVKIFPELAGMHAHTFFGMIKANINVLNP